MNFDLKIYTLIEYDIVYIHVFCEIDSQSTRGRRRVRTLQVGSIYLSVGHLTYSTRRRKPRSAVHVMSSISIILFLPFQSCSCGRSLLNFDSRYSAYVAEAVIGSARLQYECFRTLKKKSGGSIDYPQPCLLQKSKMKRRYARIKANVMPREGFCSYVFWPFSAKSPRHGL
jgi:hypothetical protein